MRIVDFDKNQVAAFVKMGWMDECSLRHYDVCKDLEAGKSVSEVALTHNISFEMARKLRDRKCRKCA